MPELLLTLTERQDFYRGIMGDSLDFSGERFTVRLWDGMDGCWCDVAANVTAEEALKVWAARTQNGTKNTGFNEIDYYCIFPADTRMVWDGAKDKEMFR